MSVVGSGARAFYGGYEARDYEIVDYRMAELPGTGLRFRGPLPASLAPGGYFAAIGAAQTFGCYCERPYPELVAQGIGLPALNLGYAGAGPEFFLRHEALLAYLNNARFVVMQVMSARSQSNSFYACGGLETVTLRQDGRTMPARAAFRELLSGPPALGRLPLPERVRRKLGSLASRPKARALVAEIRDAWVASSLELLGRIEVPVLLFWFSRRQPAYRESYASPTRLWGEFPQLVTAAMLDRVRPHAAAFVECVSSRGSPQKLYSRFTGQPVTSPFAENTYYPSPEMQEDAGRALLETCLRLAESRA